MNANDAAEIADLCNAAGQPTMAATLIREGVDIVTARARIDYAGNVRVLLAMATRIAPRMSLPEGYVDAAVRAYKPVAAIRDELFAKMAEADEAIVIDHFKRTGDGSGDPTQRSKANMVEQVKAAGLEPVKRKR